MLPQRRFGKVSWLEININNKISIVLMGRGHFMVGNLWQNFNLVFRGNPGLSPFEWVECDWDESKLLTWLEFDGDWFGTTCAVRLVHCLPPWNWISFLIYFLQFSGKHLRRAWNVLWSNLLMEIFPETVAFAINFTLKWDEREMVNWSKVSKIELSAKERRSNLEKNSVALDLSESTRTSHIGDLPRNREATGYPVLLE